MISLYLGSPVSYSQRSRPEGSAETRTTLKNNTMQIEKQIRQFILQNLYFVEDNSFSDDASFLETGVVDSMGVMELVAFIQSEFGVTTENHEVVVENFDSVGKLANFVRRKLSLSKRGASLPATERAREPASLVNPGSGKILSDHELLSRDRGAE